MSSLQSSMKCEAFPIKIHLKNLLWLDFYILPEINEMDGEKLKVLYHEKPQTDLL